jgi:hypothetical protein
MNLKTATAESESYAVVTEPLTPTPPSQVRIVIKGRGEEEEERVVRRRGRSRRKRAVRGKSICVKRLTKLEIALGKALFPDVPVERPKTRGDCAQVQRPCPFVSCTHHLYLDVFERTGAIKLNFPDLEVWEMADSCALDVADRNGTTLEEAGALMNLTRERIRQLEVKALAKLEVLAQHTSLKDTPPPRGLEKRRLPVLR